MRNWPGALWRELRLPWGSGGALAREVLDGVGLGLRRVLLAALILTLAMFLLVSHELGRILAEAPMVLEQLPRMGFSGGELWTDPPQEEALVLRDGQGREIAILDLKGDTRLEDRSASLMVTRTRLLVKGADGRVQAFPLGSPRQQAVELSRAGMLAFLNGPARITILLVSFPLLLVLGLGLLLALLGFLALLALVPNWIYRSDLDSAARLRLASLALLPAVCLISLILGLRLPLSHPSLVVLVLALGWLLRGMMAVNAELGRRARETGLED